MTLERLITDGRIHPSRIEETVEKCRREIEHKIKTEGERAILETNVHGVHHEIVKLLGRLTYRTSYCQNVLDHSIEVAHLAGIMASELGVDAVLCGHAHGGLIRLPFAGGLIGTDRSLIPDYDAGLYTAGRTQMVVSRGLGRIGLGSVGLPVRLFNRPHLPVIVLETV